MSSAPQAPHHPGATGGRAGPDARALAVRILREWTESRERAAALPDGPPSEDAAAPPDPGRAASGTRGSVSGPDRAVASDPARGSDPAADSDSDIADAGVPALAALLTSGDHADEETVTVAGRAVVSWARTAGRGSGHRGLFSGGLAGTLAGLRFGARLHPALDGVADRLHHHLATPPAAPPWRRSQVAITDYDLIVGPAGTLHALLLGPSHAALPTAHAEHLAFLCDDADLWRLRTGGYEDHPQLGWLQGRVNTGMGHGVAGLLTALTATVRRTGPTPALTGAMRHATQWLVRQSFDDARGIRSWDGAGLDVSPTPGARPRQAWCYGAAGVAWALWDAADALGDTTTAAWATAAFTTLCERYDETFHLYGDDPADRLGCCHGAAGVLAVADAFHRHAGLPQATALRARLTSHLTERLDEVATLAPRRTGLLGGATGMLCALLTATVTADHADGDPAPAPGAWRGWLRCLGLR
ncbi:lanthionine synthetase LanC family protein [Streptomyces sp. NPDC057638]|uniref:lanthionine synthetase LanC family protein n=1 Tax=Streptomyces sp. NPDC057638 TaxID=3346190 RepID=UPI003687CB0D